jgi:hypothetical protein
MTYITADELIPIAGECGQKHTISIGLLLGIILACSYAKRMKCLWWNECYVETLARELKSKYERGSFIDDR